MRSSVEKQRTGCRYHFHYPAVAIIFDIMENYLGNSNAEKFDDEDSNNGEDEFDDEVGNEEVSIDEVSNEGEDEFDDVNRNDSGSHSGSNENGGGEEHEGNYNGTDFAADLANFDMRFNNNRRYSYRMFGEHVVIEDNFSEEDVGIILSNRMIIFNDQNETFNFINDFDPVLLPNGQIRLNGNQENGLEPIIGQVHLHNDGLDNNGDHYEFIFDDEYEEAIGVLLPNRSIVFNPVNDTFGRLNDFHPVLLPDGQIQLDIFAIRTNNDTDVTDIESGTDGDEDSVY